MVGKKILVGGKNIFQFFVCVLSQNFCVPSRNFAFPRKTFVFSRKDICIPLQNFCIFSEIYLHSLTKHLRSLAKRVDIGQTLHVDFTACSGSYSSVHSQCSSSESFIVNLDSSMKKHSQFKTRFWDILKHLMWLNVLIQ